MRDSCLSLTKQNRYRTIDTPMRLDFAWCVGVVLSNGELYCPKKKYMKKINLNFMFFTLAYHFLHNHNHFILIYFNFMFFSISFPPSRIAEWNDYGCGIHLFNLFFASSECNTIFMLLFLFKFGLMLS